MKTENLPDFVIAGAPKCGTTALHAYLEDRPDVAMSDPKEPHYWATDLPGIRFVTDAESYRRSFGTATGALRGDASPFYLASRDALPALSEAVPDVKVIALFRHPVDLAYSLHAQLLYNAQEDVQDFARAWSLQEARAAGRQLPRRNHEPRLLQYREIARVGSQAARLLALFPREQVRIFLLGDLVRSTREVWVELLGFLGLPDDGRTTFPRINASKTHRWPAAGRWLIQPPRSLLVANAALKRVLGVERTNLRHALAIERKRPPLDPTFRARLVAELRPEIERLQSTLDRDLSSWLASPAG